MSYEKKLRPPRRLTQDEWDLIIAPYVSPPKNRAERRDHEIAKRHMMLPAEYARGQKA